MHATLRKFLWPPSRLERKLLEMVLQGQGSPGVQLRLWDGKTICTCHTPDMPTIYVDTRIQLLRFIFKPASAMAKELPAGLRVSDPSRIRQVYRYACGQQPAELQMVERLLRIRSS